jgi:hypothetical protein
LPSGPRLYTSPFLNNSNTSCIPSFSSSLALSASPPTSRSSASSLPLLIARWSVRALDAGRTEAPDEVDVDDDGVEALYEAAKRLALNREIGGLSCSEEGKSIGVS